MLPGDPRTVSAAKGHAVILIACLACAGCANTVQVRKTHREFALKPRHGNALTTNDASGRTKQLLRRYNLDGAFKSDPRAVLKLLDRKVRVSPDPETVFALAELSFLTARKYQRRSSSEALSLYFGAVTYAYFYLFDPAVGTETNHYDPRFRLACDLYNHSLARCLRMARKRKLRLDDFLAVELTGGKLNIEVTRHGFLWRPDEFGDFLFAEDYEVKGLSNHHHKYGLGVPLIAVRSPTAQRTDQEAFYPGEASFPVTAFLRVNCGICESISGRVAALELYDPLRIQSIDVVGTEVPLESDLTTPLAYFLAKARLEKLELTGLLRPDKLIGQSGLYMLQPYESGKVPVVLIHGLWSSPLVWMQMFNDLRGDPAIRDHYQFWFFTYPTGSPIVHSASLLRTALRDVRRVVDPLHEDKSFDQMVLVGHSMGGLLAKMMVQDSGDDLWELVSNEPLNRIKAESREIDRLRSLFFFDPEKSIRRLVFIATPHRGSALSNRPIGRLGSALIALPAALLETQARLLALNPEAFTPMFRKGLPTAVDNLSPESPVIRAIASLPLNGDIVCHSVIGNVKAGSGADRSDGVVPYQSAHLPFARSELVVPSSHNSCQSHPLTVLEVRRILLEHITAMHDPARWRMNEVTHDQATEPVEHVEEPLGFPIRQERTVNRAARLHNHRARRSPPAAESPRQQADASHFDVR